MTDWLQQTEALAQTFAETAVERDRAGGTPKHERDALRTSGLLALSIPEALGGAGAGWALVQKSVRAIARADGSLAHVYGFQHLLLATVQLFGTVSQYEVLARKTVELRWFWGNALNPLDSRTALIRRHGAPVLRGAKSFCSGAPDADMLVVSALDEASGKLVVLTLPPTRAGVTAYSDWDNMGQRQTDSGTVTFEDVAVKPEEILSTPGPLGNTRATLRPLIAQLLLVNVYTGIAEGALRATTPITRERGRAWFASGVERIEDDPFVLASLGDSHCALESASALADKAGDKLEAAWRRGDALTDGERGDLAIAVATAKVVATRAALDVTARVFETAGARATTARLGLDRFWRNVRTHTLHDPVDYKRRDIGRWILTGEWPRPSFYS